MENKVEEKKKRLFVKLMRSCEAVLKALPVRFETDGDWCLNWGLAFREYLLWNKLKVSKYTLRHIGVQGTMSLCTCL